MYVVYAIGLDDYVGGYLSTSQAILKVGVSVHDVWYRLDANERFEGKNSHSEGDSTISGAFGYLVKFLSGFTQFDPSIGDITSYFGNYVVLDDYISNSIYGYYEVSGVTFNGSETDLQLISACKASIILRNGFRLASFTLDLAFL